jgi:hypothetical protein
LPSASVFTVNASAMATDKEHQRDPPPRTDGPLARHSLAG